MVGSGLKKLAAEHAMTIDSGVAYGSLYGYAATLYEGSGWKAIAVSCLFSDGQRLAQLQEMLNGHNLQKEYRVTDLILEPDGIYIRFHDNPGTMKKLRAFCDWFFPQLADYGVTGADICPRCSMAHDGTSKWHLVNDRAVRMHDSCAAQLQNSVERQERIAEEDSANTSYGKGLLGAVLGGLLGAVIWGAVLYMGYYASLVGIIIGLLANKGYDLLGGKQKKPKIVILLLVTVLSVIVGTLGAYEFELLRLIAIGEFPGFVAADSLWMLVALFEDPEFARGAFSDIGGGMIYALLGAAVVLLRVHKETKGFKMKQLN